MKKLFYVLFVWLAAIQLAFAAIDINSASEAELDKLPGIGPVKAKAIVEERQKNGLFKSIEDIKRVKGIGDKTFQNLKSEISVSGGSASAPKPAAKPVAPAPAAAPPSAAKPVAAPAEVKKDAKAAPAPAPVAAKPEAKSPSAPAEAKKDAKAEEKKDSKADKKAAAKEKADKKKADKKAAKDAKAEEKSEKK